MYVSENVLLVLTLETRLCWTIAFLREKLPLNFSVLSTWALSFLIVHAWTFPSEYIAPNGTDTYLTVPEAADTGARQLTRIS